MSSSRPIGGMGDRFRTRRRAERRDETVVDVVLQRKQRLARAGELPAPGSFAGRDVVQVDDQTQASRPPTARSLRRSGLRRAVRAASAIEGALRACSTSRLETTVTFES
jgi:hypothetical protein